MSKLNSTKFAALAAGLVMAGSLAFAPVASAASLTSSQIQSILGLLSSFGADSSTIANVQSALTGSPVVSTVDTTTKAGVTALQKELIAQGYDIPAITKGGVAYGFYGAQTKAAQAARAKAQASSSTSTTTPVVGSGVKVGLSSTSPVGSVLVATQGIGKIAEFSFTNTSASAVSVSALTFKRIGVSNDSSLDNVYLYNGVTRLTDSAGVSNSAFTFSDPTALFTVPANSTYIVAVRADIATGTEGQQVGAQLVSVGTNGTLDSSVVFPISSGLQTISKATMATVTFGSNVTPSGTQSISPQASFPIWQDTVDVVNTPVNMASVKFTNLGSIDSSVVQNLRLIVDGVQVGSTVGKISADRTVLFDLSANPISLSTQSHTVKVLADVNGGASRTIQFSIQRSSDVMFIDSQLNQPVRPTFTGTASTGTVTVNFVQGANGVSVSTDPSSPSSDVAKNATNVKLATFDLLASGEDVKVSDLFVSASVPLINGKIRVNGTQLGSSHNIASSTTADFGMGSSLILKAGVITRVDVYADTKDVVGPIVITLAHGSANAQGQTSLNAVDVPAQISGVQGNTVNVVKSSLAASRASGYGDQAIVAGTTNAKLGEFNLSAGATEGVTVNTVAFKLLTGNAAELTNLTLKDSVTGVQIGQVITTPSDSSNSFNVSLDIPASSTKTIDIFGNVLSNASVSPIKATLLTTTAGTGDITGISANSEETLLQSITIGSGQFNLSLGAGDPTSTNVVAGQSSQVGQFRFSAVSTSYTVQNLAILVPNGVSGSVQSVTVSYKDINGATQTQTQPLNSNGSEYATSTFTGLAMYVSANSATDANLDVSVKTNVLSSNGSSGAEVRVTLDAGATNGTFRAVNSAGVATTTINGGVNLQSSGKFYVRKSIPTFAMIPVTATVPTSGNALYRFSITADNVAPIDWKKVTFNVSTSSVSASTMLTNAHLVDEASGLDVNSQTTIVTGDTITVDLSSAQQIAAGATKTYALYGTVNGFTTGSSLTISLAPDTTNVSSNTQWSDRVGAFTNGYLLKNFTTNATSYSK